MKRHPDFDKFREEANRIYPHMTPEERDAQAEYLAQTHPGFHTKAIPSEKPSELILRHEPDKKHTRLLKWILFVLIGILGLLIFRSIGHAEPGIENVAHDQALQAILSRHIFAQNVITGKSDVSGNLLVGINNWGGTVLGAPANFGTTPGAVVVGSVNSSLFLGTTSARSNQTTTATGVLDVNIVGSLGATSSVTNGEFTQITDNTTKVAVIAATNALKTDMSSMAGTAITNTPTAIGTKGAGNVISVNSDTTSIAGTATVTAAAGVQKVGIVGNANSTVDATLGSALPTNALADTPVPSSVAGAAATLFQNSAVTTAVVVKASAGNLYGFLVNGGTSGNFLQFINAASAPVLGTAAVFSIQIPASGIIAVPPGTFAMNTFATGISLGISTTYNGASAGTAAAVVAFYK